MNKKGLSLTELMVATMLIGIVMLGVASFSQTVQQASQSVQFATTSALQVASVLNRIADDASNAIGDLSSMDNFGINCMDTAFAQFIGFRSPVDLSNDVNSYSDNAWIIYLRDGIPNPSDPDQLYRCDTSTTASGPIFNFNDAWAECITNPTDYELLITLPSEDDFLTFFRTNPDRCLLGPGDTIDNVQLEIMVRQDYSRDEHPITNPSYHATTQISPLGHSR